MKTWGCPVHACARPAEEVRAAGARRGVGGHLSVEAVHVEAGLAGVEAEMAVGKLGLGFEKGVVHLPKAPLQTGGFGGLCCILRVRVDRGKREIAKDEAQPIAERLPDLADHGICLAAMQALKNPIFHQSHGCGGRAQEMVAFTDRGTEFENELISDAAA